MIAKVLINTTVKTLNKVYDYNVPINLQDNIEIGKRVEVSFGREKNTEGIVVKLVDDSDLTFDYELKDIISILDEVSYIDSKRLQLAKYISYMYFCNVYDALKLMLPPGTASKNTSKSLNTKMETKVSLIKTIEQVETDIQNGILKSAKQIRVVRFLIENNTVLLNDIINGLSISRNILKTLEKNGYILLEKYAPEVDLLKQCKVKPTVPNIPTFEQKNAIDKVSEYIFKEEYKQFLLFGVTGSRKN